MTTCARAILPPLALLIALSLMMMIAPVSAQLTLRLGVIDGADGSLLRGALLAARRVNDRGGLVAADGKPFHLAVVDTPPDNMDIAIANMRQASAIAVIGPARGDLVERFMPQLLALQVPVITPATGDTVLLGDHANRVFRGRAAANVRAAALADYAARTLGVRTVRALQLDGARPADLISFANALDASGIRLSNSAVDEADPELDAIARELEASNVGLVAIFGPPEAAARVTLRLRGAGYQGAVAYDGALAPDFTAEAPVKDLAGVIAAATWSPALPDAASQAFVLDYVRAFAEVPDETAAAGYDATLAIAEALLGPGSPSDNLATLSRLQGAQGELNPAELRRGELSGNALVLALNEYGAPDVVARYRGGRRVSLGEPLISRQALPPSPPPPATPTPAPTPTPAGYNLTIQSNVQNVRSGPGLDFEVIGQLRRGAQALVLGATPDYAWLVIDYRGQWGWLAAHLVVTYGNRSLLPVIQPPTTPTPPSAILAPAQSEADIVVLRAAPARVILDQPAAISVTVANQGATAAGSFAIATTLGPGGIFAGVNVPRLEAGAQTTVQLNASLRGATGPQSVIIVADLNNEVAEGAAGEANNRAFAYRYLADRAQLASGASTAGIGTVDLDGYGVADLNWTGAELVALGGAGMYQMSAFGSIDDAHYDAIDLSRASLKSLRIEQLTDATIGLRTADGHRGVLKLRGAPRDGRLAFDFRVYR